MMMNHDGMMMLMIKFFYIILNFSSIDSDELPTAIEGEKKMLPTI